MDENIEFYLDFKGDDFYEFIQCKLYNLKNKNEDYKNFSKLKENYLDKYPVIRIVIDDDIKNKLTEEECDILIKVLELERKMREIVEQEMFFIGGKETYKYLKNLDLIKE